MIANNDAEGSNERGKTVVFATYHLQSEDNFSDEAAKSNWYPSIYFYDLEKNAVTWTIYGAEIFVNIDNQNNVMVLTNEIWSQLTERAYSEKAS